MALRLLFNTLPDRTPKLLEQSLQGLVDDGYTNKSYKVFNIGAANDLPALSAEHGFTMQSNHYIAAIDKFLEIAQDAAERGRAFQTGPIAVRFVKGSGFLMSPQHGRNTAMTEMIAVSGTTTAPEMLHRYEEAAYGMDGRPHLGQLNHLAVSTSSQSCFRVLAAGVISGGPYLIRIVLLMGQSLEDWACSPSQGLSFVEAMRLRAQLFSSEGRPISK